MAAPLPVLGDPASHRVRDALADYLATGQKRNELVRPFVLDSWERCRRSGIDPAKGGPATARDDAFAELIERERDLAESADAAMRHLARLLEGCESMAVLCGPDGVILRILGDPTTIAQGRQSRITEGANWHELASGTNAIGTALTLGRPVQIHASEHFCEWARPWSCAATLVRDPIDGRIVGAVDVTALSHRFEKQSAALAQVAATLAEQQLAVLEQGRRARLLEHFIARSADWPGDGLILLDRRGRVVHANAPAQAAGARLAQDLRAAASDDSRPLRDRLRAAAPWLDPDHLEAVGVEAAPIGMLVVLPDRRRAARPIHQTPKTIDAQPSEAPDTFPAGDPALSPLQQAERAALIAALRRARGNLSRAARDLTVSRTTLYKRMQAYGLDRDGKGWL